MIGLLLVLLAQVVEGKSPSPIRVVPPPQYYQALGAGSVARTRDSKEGDIISAKDYGGVDMCAQISTAILALPVSGGIIDATSYTGTQSCASNPFSVQGITPVVLLLGTTRIQSSVPWVIGFSNTVVAGRGVTQTVYQYTGGASAYAFKIGTATPLTTQLQGVVLEKMSIWGNANTTDVLLSTGIFRSFFSEIELKDATGCGLHTQWDVVNTYRSVHVTGFGYSGAFLVTPASGLCFDQIDASHQTTASTVIDPVAEAVSGSGLKLNGAVNMVLTGGTSESNARGIEILSGSDRNTIIGIDLESNSVEDGLISSKYNSFIGILSTTTFHVTSTGHTNTFSGGGYNSFTIDAGAIANELAIAVKNNGGTITDNGTDTVIDRLYDVTAGIYKSIPWAFRQTVPPLTWVGVGAPDRQDLIAGSYTFTTAATTISNTPLTASKPWRVLFVGVWGNNFEGGGLAEPAPVIEATTASPTFAIGSVNVTVSVNGSNQLQAITGANTAAFSGRIFVMSNNLGAAGTASMLLQGNVTASSLTPTSGMTANAGGFKHKRAVAGCATAASIGAVCSTTFSWGTAFADANYTVQCLGNAITSGAPILQGITAKVAASVTVQTIALTAVAAQFTNIECIATHD